MVVASKNGFWFWKEQLEFIVSAVALIIEYDIWEEEIEIIQSTLYEQNLKQ